MLPQYSGGLGILAGDHLKSASDLGVPIIGVGLLYRHGYFTQSLSADGWQAERYPADDPNGLPLTLLRSADGEPVKVTVPFPDGKLLTAQVWLAQVGRVPLLMLDSYVEENEPAQHEVTDRLYGGGSEHRLRQELLLGIGGVRAVRAFCAITGHPEPEVFHTNEGHAGFLGLERIREYVAAGLTFDEALELSRAGTVFTTHTPVPAGIDRFPRELIERYFTVGRRRRRAAARPGARARRGDLPGRRPAHVQHGRHGHAAGAAGQRRLAAARRGQPGDVRGPVAGLRHRGGADRLDHQRRARADLGRARGLRPRRLGERRGRAGRERLWAIRRQLRARLVTETRRRLRESWQQRGASGAELTWIDDVLDENVLTIGFARRVPSYKRLTLMLNDPQRLAGLLLDPDRPIQIVIAGKAHPADEGGKRLIQQMVRFADSEAVRRRIVFLPDYDMAMARFLVQGCDVWLNNPLRPLEACGTSGMKVALNGGLNLSVRDGWWDEWYDGGNGWEIPTADGVEDPSRRDELEASALYELIAKSVAPLFYDAGADGVPHGWVEMLRHGLRSLGPLVQADRMVGDYVTKLYAPAAQASRALAAADNGTARGLAAWKARVRQGWAGVRIEHVEADGAEPSLGAVLDVRVTTSLGRLSAGRRLRRGRLRPPRRRRRARRPVLRDAHRRGLGAGAAHPVLRRGGTRPAGPVRLHGPGPPVPPAARQPRRPGPGHLPRRPRRHVHGRPALANPRKTRKTPRIRTGPGYPRASPRLFPGAPGPLRSVSGCHKATRAARVRHKGRILWPRVPQGHNGSSPSCHRNSQLPQGP